MTRAACGRWKPRLPSHPNFITLCSLNPLLWPRHHEIVALMSVPRILPTCWFIALWWGSDWQRKGGLDSIVLNYSLWYMRMLFRYLVSKYAKRICFKLYAAGQMLSEATFNPSMCFWLFLSSTPIPRIKARQKSHYKCPGSSNGGIKIPKPNQSLTWPSIILFYCLI